jgi:hypothetical protein
MRQLIPGIKIAARCRRRARLPAGPHLVQHASGEIQERETRRTALSRSGRRAEENRENKATARHSSSSVPSLRRTPQGMIPSGQKTKKQTHCDLELIENYQTKPNHPHKQRTFHFAQLKSTISPLIVTDQSKINLLRA